MASASTGWPLAGRQEPGRIVVTGFRSFPGVAENPSQRVLEALQSTSGRLPDDAQCHLLETAYANLSPALDGILANPPAALVMTGFSALADGFKLERRASDVRSPRFPDASGFVPQERIGAAVDWQENRSCHFPALEEALIANGFACDLSDDAGQYVCNSAYYMVLKKIAEQGLTTRAIFVHLPAIEATKLAGISASTMPLSEMVRGVALVARFLAQR